MCPIHPTNTPAWRQSGIKFTSYLMNGAVIRSPGDFKWDDGAAGRTYKNTDYRPTDMLFWESDEKDSGNFNDASSKPTEGFSRRHSKGAILGMFGGHVAFMKYDRYEALVREPNRNEFWCWPKSRDGHF